MTAKEPSGSESPSPQNSNGDNGSSAAPTTRLKSYQVTFILTISTVFLIWTGDLVGLIRFAEPLLMPLGYLQSLLPGSRSNSTMGFILLWVLGLAYLFGLWFLVVWGWRSFSRGFKVAMAICALASIGCSWGLKAYREQADWSSRGFNPDRSGFNPPVVLLAGTFDYQHKGWETGSLYTGTARFEIRMRGADYYYAERWTGHQRKYGSWKTLTLSMPDFSGTWNRRYSAYGTKGGGTSSESSDSSLLIARRLWQGQEFVGAISEDEFSLNGTTEHFFDLKQHGRFKIPERIKWTSEYRRETLHIRRVEFLNEPNPDWFVLIKQKYFGRGDESRQLWKTNLNEAGWSGIQ